MSEPQQTKEERQAARAAEREEQRAADEQAQQRRAQQQAAQLRTLETSLLTMAIRTATDSGLDWPAIVDTLERVTAATRALASGKK